jgi:DNA-binding transcriptional ArsR family regulator
LYLCTMTTPQERGHRVLDIDSIKGLAHPLRVQLLDALSLYGPDTASGLAARLGESSGATSYHLRQLEKHGFVRDDPTRGSARERWWERSPGGIAVNPTDFPPNSAGRIAAEMIEREWDRGRNALLSDFTARGAAELEKDWYDASTIDTVNLLLTKEQLAALVNEVEDITDRYAAKYKRQGDPGSRRFQVQLNAFPILAATDDRNVGGTA